MAAFCHCLPRAGSFRLQTYNHHRSWTARSFCLSSNPCCIQHHEIAQDMGCLQHPGQPPSSSDPKQESEQPRKHLVVSYHAYFSHLQSVDHWWSAVEDSHTMSVPCDRPRGTPQHWSTETEAFNSGKVQWRRTGALREHLFASYPYTLRKSMNTDTNITFPFSEVTTYHKTSFPIRKASGEQIAEWTA